MYDSIGDWSVMISPRLTWRWFFRAHMDWIQSSCDDVAVGQLVQSFSNHLIKNQDWALKKDDMRDPRLLKVVFIQIIDFIDSWCSNKSLWFVVFKNIHFDSSFTKNDRASSRHFKSNPSSPGRSSAWSPRMLARTSSLRYWASGAPSETWEFLSHPSHHPSHSTMT